MLNDFNFPKNFPFFDVNLFGHDFSKSTVLYLLFYSSKDINNRCPTCQNRVQSWRLLQNLSL